MRLKAFLTHLLISLLVGGCCWLLIRYWWFPGPFFAALSADGLVRILVPADIVLGPLLTLVVYRAGKARAKLIFDLVCIGCVQGLALAYGVWVIHQVRPVHVVLAGNELYVHRAVDLPEGAAVGPFWQAPIWSILPYQNAVQAEVDLAIAALQGQLPTLLNPAEFTPMAGHEAQLRARLLPLSASEQANWLGNRTASDAAASPGQQFGKIPMRIRDHQWFAVLDMETLNLIAIVTE